MDELHVLGLVEPLCPYCELPITEGDAPEVLGRPLHTACAARFRLEYEEAALQELMQQLS